MQHLQQAIRQKRMCDKPFKNVHNIDSQAEKDYVDGQLKQEETFIRKAAQVDTMKEFLQDISTSEDVNDTVLLDNTDLQPDLPKKPSTTKHSK